MLEDAEAQRRLLVLAGLQAALSELGVRCTLARNHRLVLRYNDGLVGPNGLTDPKLYIFAESGTATVTTDRHSYRLGGGQEIPVTDPAAAAIIRLATTPAVRS